MLPYRCVSPQCAMPLCQSYTRFDACPVSCLRCMSPCSTPVLLLSLLSPGSRPVSAGSLCCKLVLALPDFKPTQAKPQSHNPSQCPKKNRREYTCPGRCCQAATCKHESDMNWDKGSCTRHLGCHTQSTVLLRARLPSTEHIDLARRPEGGDARCSHVQHPFPQPQPQ